MEENKKDYKNTLLMPQTEFSMKADLVKKQDEYIKNWEQNKIYQKVLEKNKGNKPFVLHDGPPYANGNIHVGHALNKILKDIVVRFRSMQGYFSPYVAGWDTHGLPIEHKMLSENKKQAKDFSVTELRKACHDYALSQVNHQISQFKKLALLTDFKDIYLTLDKNVEMWQLKLFQKMVNDKLIYRDLKPVYWSPSSQSALAEAEVEYAEHISPSITVAFEVNNGNKYVAKGNYVLIWTTTPWTLIANAAAAISEKFDYVLVEVNKKRYVLAKELLENVAKDCKWEQYKILKTLKGKDLINLTYISPINKNICPMVFGHHVTLDTGTGIVHIAPLFGEDDFIIGNKFNLNKIMHINDDGTINEKGLSYKDMFYEDANPKIGKYLEENGLLLSFKRLKHQYPHDWRTHLPIMYRATPQWFVSLAPIKDKLQKAIKTIKTYNEWSEKRLSLMLENRESWCISRQRKWGVPIIIFYDKNKKPVFNNEIFDYVIDLVAKHGSDIWYEKPANELLPKKFRGLGFSKENDIMDVWFDSGSTSISIKPSGLEAPFDLYLEGSDQYRGWFNSSLINSVAWRNKSPFKALVSHGFVLDGKGNKMSKSKGNVVDPLDVINKYGADILRMWVANSEYTSDVSIDDKIIQQNIEIYRKIRNTIKFMLGGLNDYTYQEIKLDSVHELMYERILKLENTLLKFYEEYKFLNIIKEINNFIIDFSGYYISITKDILYLESKNSNERLQVQFIFYKLTELLIKALAPILPITCEEIYSYFPAKNKVESIHLLNFLKHNEIKTTLEEKWAEFFALKDEIYRLIEQKIQSQEIKRQNEAEIFVNSKSSFIKSLDLVKLLMVVKVNFANINKVQKLENSYKCLRCWNHFEAKDFDKNLEICMRCKKVINGK